MSATTGGYQTIGTATPAPPAPSGNMPTSDNPTITPSERLQAVARGAGAAAVGAKEAVSQLITAPMPDVNLYTEPLNPHAKLSLKDRAQLVMESCRPWSVFFDPKSFAIPEAAEVKLRVGNNVEVFFYNYMVVAFALLLVFAVFHPLRALLMAVLLVSAGLLYILYPEDYKVNENITVSRPIKHVLIGLMALLVLTVGGVLEMLFWVVMAFWPVVLLHAFLREHSANASVPSTI